MNKANKIIRNLFTIPHLIVCFLMGIGYGLYLMLTGRSVMDHYLRQDYPGWFFMITYHGYLISFIVWLLILLAILL